MDSLDICSFLIEPALEVFVSLFFVICHRSHLLGEVACNSGLCLLSVIDKKMACHIRDEPFAVHYDSDDSLRSLYLSSFY